MDREEKMGSKNVRKQADLYSIIQNAVALLIFYCLKKEFSKFLIEFAMVGKILTKHFFV